MPHYCLLSCFLLLFWKGQKSTQNRVIQSYCQRWNGHRFLSDLQRKLFKCEEGIPFESAVLLDHHIDKTQDHWDLIPVGRRPESCFQCDIFSLLPFLSKENFCLEESHSPYLRFTSFIANLEAVVSEVAAPQMRVLGLPTSAAWNVCVCLREPWAHPPAASWPC